MVTTKGEGLHLVGILLRYLSKEKAIKMIKDMDFEIAETTDNESLRDSIKMVSGYLE
jgi:hypothetical protein|tara:strand:+ start:352 stop:522 length:171 start_codon:yes stop_codon:yes gene_type:complete